MAGDIALADLASEPEHLQPWLSAFARFFEQPVRVDTDAEGGVTLSCPRVFRPIELIGAVNHLKMHPAVVEHVRRLGFAWEADGRVLTVPTPATFNQRLAQYGRPDAGFRLAWAREQSATMALGPWLRRYMRGILSVQSCHQSYFDQCLAEGPKGKHARPLEFLLSSLIHELSVHALNYHLIPHSALAELARRIEQAVPERVERWSRPGSMAPVTFTYFYDNDLNRYAYAVWGRTTRPEDFGANFVRPQWLDQLLAALEVRLRETIEGVGDVPSGQFEEMKPLQQTSFDIR